MRVQILPAVPSTLKSYMRLICYNKHMQKECRTCNMTKPLDDFAKGSSYKDGRRNICKLCASKRQREYWYNNQDQYEAHKKRVKHNDGVYKQTYRRHHTTKEHIDALKDRYNGLCCICRYRPAIVIDHDHSCCPGTYSCGLCIRGVLCSQCNTSLGLLGEDAITISNMLNYIGVSSNG